MILQDTAYPSISKIETFPKTDNPSWSQRYGEKHRLEWIKDFPQGITPPQRVRIYRRAEHFVLQWWDPAAKQNLSDRVEGDLVAAISRARQVEERLEHFRGSGHRSQKFGHAELVEKYLADLTRRADAGEVDPRTVTRYRSALQRHYLAYALEPEIERQFRYAAAVNRDFQLGFSAYLNAVQVPSNGHRNSIPRPLRGQNYVIDVVRGMFAWAADPDRGGLLPEGFRNPFVQAARASRKKTLAQLDEPDITLPMACDFLQACDAYQLRLFAPLVCYGLRAAEPCFLFYEDLDRRWLRIRCHAELAYQTKGRRDKHLPLLPCLAELLTPGGEGKAQGLVYVNRRAQAGDRNYPLWGCSLAALAEEFERRCRTDRAATAAARRTTQNTILAAAGGITYDHLVHEFRCIHRLLGWPPKATLKDFRHLFSTLLENASVGVQYQQYLLGHSPGRAALVHYTHLDEIRERYEEFAARRLPPLIDAVRIRARQLGISLLEV